MRGKSLLVALWLLSLFAAAETQRWAEAQLNSGSTLLRGSVTVNGTANEITATQSGSTVTLSLPSALTLTGKTITGGTFSGPTILLPNGTAAAPSIAFDAQGDNDGLYYDTVNGSVAMVFDGTARAAWDGGSSRAITLNLSPSGELSWAASGTMFTAADTSLTRASAGVVNVTTGYSANSVAGLTTTVVVACNPVTQFRTLTITGGLITSIGTCA